MEFDLDSAIELPMGLPGFADMRRFGLGPMPGTTGEQFLLLQSLDDPSLSFIVLPASLEGGPIAAQDIADTAGVLAIEATDVAVLLIVTAREEAGDRLISVNLRAPVFVDTRRQKGWQFVLSNNGYPVRHVISRTPVESSAA